jgi:hypothetical protein
MAMIMMMTKRRPGVKDATLEGQITNLGHVKM